MTDQDNSPISPADGYSRMPNDLGTKGKNADLTQMLFAMVTTGDHRRVSMRELITEPTLLLLVDRERAMGHRSVAGIFWVEERLASDLRLAVVWPIPAHAALTGFPARESTIELLDHAGELGRLLAPSGQQVGWMVNPEGGTLVRITAGNQAFAASRDWRAPNRQEADRVIDLGDLII